NGRQESQSKIRHITTAATAISGKEGPSNLFRLKRYQWERQAQRIARRLEQRQRPPARPILSRLVFWPSTAPAQSSARPNTASSARGKRSSKASLVQRATLLLDRLCPRLRLGTRLVWRPWHRLKHRTAAWLLCQLMPVSFSGLLTLSSRAASPSRGATSARQRGKPASRAKRWLVLIVRHVCRKMIAHW